MMSVGAWHLLSDLSGRFVPLGGSSILRDLKTVASLADDPCGVACRDRHGQKVTGDFAEPRVIAGHESKSAADVGVLSHDEVLFEAVIIHPTGVLRKACPTRHSGTGWVGNLRAMP